MKRVSSGVVSLVAILVSLGWGSALSHADFVHPGLLNNRAEYDLMKAKVAAKANPWYSAYQQIPDYRSYTPKPVADFHTDPPDYSDADEHLDPDGKAAYSSALHWIVTGNTQHAEKAKQILNAWAYTLKSIGSGEDYLQISWKWFPMMQAAEILKHAYSNWSGADQAQFEKILRTLIIPKLQGTNISGSSKSKSNWAAYGAHSRMAIGIYLDDQAMVNQAISDTRALLNFYIGSHGNPVPAGFTYETCRSGNGGFGSLDGGDLTHTQMGLSGLAHVAEMAKKQGINLYSHTDPSDGAGLVTALIYHAPFMGYPNRSGSSAATWPCKISITNSAHLGTTPAFPWQLAYNHYRHAALKGVADYMGPAGNTNRAGTYYDKLTHNYGSTSSSPPPSVVIKAPVNVRVVSTQ
jgi:Alginate lyase